MPKGGDGMPARKKEPEDLTAKKELALEVIDRLKKEYPDAGCTLDYDHACWQLSGKLPDLLVYISLFSFEYLYLIIVLSDYKVMSTPNVQMRGVMALVKGSEVLHLEITNALSTLILNLRLSIINLLINFFGNV